MSRRRASVPIAGDIDSAVAIVVGSESFRSPIFAVPSFIVPGRMPAAGSADLLKCVILAVLRTLVRGLKGFSVPGASCRMDEEWT